MENKSDPQDLHGTVVLWSVFFAVVFGHKFYPTFLKWFSKVENRIAVLTLAVLALAIFIYRLVDRVRLATQRNRFERGILGYEKGSVFCGISARREKVYIKTRQRTMHTQVIGTTNAGKTESVILPWAIQDIANNRGLILIDGKADTSLLDKLYSYVVRQGRQKDFRLFSISNIRESSQFNPLIGGTCEQIAERVFNSFEFENSYYRSVQFEIFSQILRIFQARGLVPTFSRIHEAISYPGRMSGFVPDSDRALQKWLQDFIALDSTERGRRTSGLTAALSHFAFGEPACLFNTESPTIDLDEALKQNKIIYFQLPVLMAPFLGRATGKLVLQALQSAIAKRHLGADKDDQSFFSIFLDDFTEYLYPGFVSILNKTRSANIGVVFAHQALGDIKSLGEPIANSILTNSNLKIFMRGSDPESAEYFARVIGTKETMKFTERTRRGLSGQSYTGDSSAREVEEFVIHPNRFKSSLGVGEAVLVVPHERGSKSVHLKFQKLPDLARVPLVEVAKPTLPGLPVREIKNERKSKCNLEY